MFRRAMGVIFEMILAECGRSRAADQKEASAQMHKTIAALLPTEFPNLTELREVLALPVGLAFRPLEGEQNAAPDGCRVFEGLQARREGLPIVVTEIGVPRRPHRRRRSGARARSRAAAPAPEPPRHQAN